MEIEIRKKYEGDHLYGEFSYSQKTNIRHGLQKFYHRNGVLKAHWYFNNGRLHAIGQWWHSNGTRRDIAQRKNARNHGVAIDFRY
jgi:antitoxin component YwqK of YwqJK toxin-antitoxin module